LSRRGPNGPKRVQRFFDEMRAAFDELADAWDATHGPGSRNGRGFDARLRYLRSICHGRVRPRILDVGCASGLYLFGLLDLVSKGVGIDASPRMIDRARAVAARYQGVGTLHFMVAAVEKITPAAFGRHLCGLARDAGLEPVSLFPVGGPPPWNPRICRGFARSPSARPLWASLTYAAHLASPGSRGTHHVRHRVDGLPRVNARVSTASSSI
jgi:SAM-dependent methyltransferase